MRLTKLKNSKLLLILGALVFSFLLNVSSVHADTNSETNISLFAAPTTKNVSVTVTYKNGSSFPSNQYYYNDGVYKGWIPMVDFSDQSQNPNIKGYVCTYRGKVSRVAIPTSAILE